MKLRVYRTSRPREEGAIFLPLIAVVAMAVIGVVIGLGFDTLLVKRAAAVLRKNTEAACKLAAWRPTFQKNAAKIFAENMNEAAAGELRERGLILTSVRLITPTFPVTGEFCQFDPTLDCTTLPPINAPDPLLPIKESGTLSPCPSGASCTFDGNVSDNADYPAYDSSVVPSLPNMMPAGAGPFWNNLQSVGNTIGCETEADVRTIFSVFTGTRQVTAKVVWKIGVRGEFGPYDHRNAVKKLSTAPGLVVAVAPHLTTSSTDNRFLFSDPPFTASDFNSFNPLRASGVKGFDQDPALATDLRRDPDLRDFEPQAEVAGADDRKELLVSCMNPLILVRNSFLSTILEFASRNGELRNMTELLLVGTEHRVMQGGNSEALPITANPPVKIIGFGEDLVPPLDGGGAVTAGYQIPYVYFDMGVALGANVPATFEPAQGVTGESKINPFENVSTDPLRRQQSSLLSAQLRHCYHLYQGSADGISRKGIFNLSTINDGYEPVEAFRFNEKLRSSPYGSSGTLWWDQSAPWGGSWTGTGTWPLTGPELVSALGSIQKCPYRYNIPITGTPTCEKPAEYAGPFTAFDDNDFSTVIPATADLRPDLVGLLAYLGSHDFSKAGGPSNFPAVNSPGLFSFAFPGDDWQPFDSAKYSTALNYSAPILIVLHQRLSVDEALEVNNLLNTLPNLGNRPITIVYFPPTAADADHDSSLALIKWAFKVPAAQVPGNMTQNALFVFAPASTASAADFQDYWHTLIGSGPLITELAENIYYERLLYRDLKL